jgi:hypothetical protein
VAELAYRDAFTSKPICNPIGESGLICERVPIRSGNRSTFDVGTYHERMKTTRSLDSWMVDASTCIYSPEKIERGLSDVVYDVQTMVWSNEGKAIRHPINSLCRKHFLMWLRVVLWTRCKRFLREEFAGGAGGMLLYETTCII